MPITVTPTAIPDVLLIEPAVFRDERGFLMESFNARDFREATGVQQALSFVQDNHSHSKRGVLRGLHYQLVRPQGKLVRVTRGEIFDVAVDLRRSSPTFGKWVGARLSEENHRQLWLPTGFAHGFLVLSETADVQYKATELWAPEHGRSIRWDDPSLGIEWPVGAGVTPLLSARDAAAGSFAEAECFD